MMEDFDNEDRKLVEDFERTVMVGRQQFFDLDEMETIIDYYLESGENESLQRAVDYGVSLYPDSIEMRLRIAHLLITRNQVQEALQKLRELKVEDPENRDIDYSLGVAYGAGGMHQEAVQCYLRALDDGWETGRIYANMAEEYYMLRQYDEALRYYELSLDTKEYETATLYNYQDTASLANLMPQAIAYLRSFTKEHPYDADAWLCLGRLLEDNGETDQALEAMEFALAINSRFETAYQDMGRIYESHDNPVMAISTYRQALGQGLDPVYFNSSIVAVYVSMQNYDAALPYMQKALEAEPDNPQLMGFVAINYLNMDLLDKCGELVTRGLKLDSNCPSLLAASAMMLEAYGEVDKARQAFSHMMEVGGYTMQELGLYIHFLYTEKEYDTLMQLIVDEELFDESYFVTYYAAAAFRANAYNTASKFLPHSIRQLLLSLCPEIVERPILEPFLPKN